jgi:hypothetical protein
MTYDEIKKLKLTGLIEKFKTNTRMALRTLSLTNLAAEYHGEIMEKIS